MPVGTLLVRNSNSRWNTVKVEAVEVARRARAVMEWSCNTNYRVIRAIRALSIYKKVLST